MFLRLKQLIMLNFCVMTILDRQLLLRILVQQLLIILIPFRGEILAVLYQTKAIYSVRSMASLPTYDIHLPHQHSYRQGQCLLRILMDTGDIAKVLSIPQQALQSKCMNMMKTVIILMETSFQLAPHSMNSAQTSSI